MKEFDREQLTKLIQDREVKNTEDLQELLRDLTKEVTDLTPENWPIEK